MKKFSKRTAIVTGGASGIGGGCAKKLASEIVKTSLDASKE